jgi:hypothetical protein
LRREDPLAVLELKTDPTREELRRFGMICLVGFAVVGSVVLWRSGSLPAAVAFFAAGVLAAAVGLAAPPALKPLFLFLVIVTYPIGWILSHLLLASVYFLVITPIGLALRLFGTDPLERRFDPHAESYWKPTETQKDVERYFKGY